MKSICKSKMRVKGYGFSATFNNISVDFIKMYVDQFYYQLNNQ